MMTSRNTVAILGVLPALLFAACADVAGPKDGHLIHGAILDAETGEPVSRETVYVHLFCDAIDFQLSLELEDETTYAARMPERAVRLRVADTSGRYTLYEETFSIDDDAAEHDARLEPTHYVRLFGKVTDLNTGKPVSFEGDGTIGSAPILGFMAEGYVAGGEITIGPGTYSVRVPRTKLQVSVLDTPLSPQVGEIDLTGFEGEEYEFDVDLK